MSNHTTWYKDEAAYLRMKEFCVDKEHFGPSYKEWCLKVQKKIDDLAKSGTILIKADIEPDAFIAWCAKTSNIPDGKARSLFTTLHQKQNSAQVGDNTAQH